MQPPTAIQKHMPKLREVCQLHRVDKLYAFGSVLTERFDENRSDLDFLVELAPLPPIEKGETLMNLWDALEELFERKVDLLTDQPIKNPYLKRSIDQTKQLIYDGRSEKISL